MSRSEDRERKKRRSGKKRERFTRPTAAPGPCLAAIRSRCSASGGLGELLPVFEQIGRNLDRAVPWEWLDELILGRGDRLLVAVSDAAWRKQVLVTQYSSYEVERAFSEADDMLRGHAADGLDPISSVRETLADWSERARSFQQHEFFAERGHSIDVCVGAVLALQRSRRAEIDGLLASKQAPALLIALSSLGATPHNPCSLGVMVIAVQDWARPNGPVAGHA
ncbi:hypothetical protein I8G32_04702 [Rhodopseudomonas palustris]|uniref:Uncharacterized protein n=1 Tax=Rhodopseudomonas palustris (strain ATCC BAA-98 / CGA009) TaxID=258594 RepID=Q6N162_RHOPA|nr:hypothetical protein I8G32_04702 [Rhodopseudomonas palustris]CAE29987.1 hypothetical protein RPA4547 [Rhodopseudomonas palustris CGA009]